MKKNKLYLLTRHSIANYGSLMQTIASQKVLNSLGFDVTVINYVSKNETIFGNLCVNAKKKTFFKGLLYVFTKFPIEIFNSLHFYFERKKYLNMTKRYSNRDEIEQAKIDMGGIICVGSDQVWGMMPNGKLDPTYFIDFATKNKCISFASSMGKLDYADDELAYIVDKLKKFEFITVREATTAKILNEKGLKVSAILDPTLLVEQEYWHNLADECKIKEKYILVYQLRKNDEMTAFIERIEKEKGIKAIRLSASLVDKFRYKNVKTLKVLPYVLSLFKYADFVITDSFHASVFSIIFEKQFRIFLPPVTGLRIQDLVNNLNIRDCVFNNKLDASNIDYKSVNNKLSFLRTKSISLLKANLDKVM